MGENVVCSKTLLVDFDGVLRHWFSSAIGAAEGRCNVANGTLLKTAFSETLLNSVVTGKIAHSEWEKLVGDRLSQLHGRYVSECLVKAWINETWEIDEFLLSELIRVAPNQQLVLVTNATDRLQKDLIKSDLESKFDFVVNSSEIGVAKPNIDFYRHVLTMSNCKATDCVYIDDSIDHIRAARTMGITSVLHESVEKTLETVERTCA